VDEESQRPRSGSGLGARMARALGRRPRKPPETEEPEPPLVDPGAYEPVDSDWLDATMRDFEDRISEALKQAGEELYAQVERDLAETEQRLRETERRLEENVSARLDGAVAELRVQGDAQLAAELQRVKDAAETPLASIRKVEADATIAAEAAASRAERSAAKAAGQIEAAAEKLGVRARRQELKLVREETSKRMTGAIARLEHQAELRMAEVQAIQAESAELLAQVDERVTAAAAASTELERRLFVLGERLAETERHGESAGALIEDAVARLEQVLGSIEEAERRVLEIEDRVVTTARRITELGEHAERAVDWEGRMAAAMQTEADAAARITEAERRLLDRIDPGTSQS
jgi:chromosome segregation ATPase